MILSLPLSLSLMAFRTLCSVCHLFLLLLSLSSDSDLKVYLFFRSFVFRSVLF